MFLWLWFCDIFWKKKLIVDDVFVMKRLFNKINFFFFGEFLINLMVVNFMCVILGRIDKWKMRGGGVGLG